MAGREKETEQENIKKEKEKIQLWTTSQTCGRK